MTLVKYLYKKFIPCFLGALFFFSMMLVLVDLLMNLWQFIQNQVPVAKIGRLMLLYVPKTLWYAAPLAVLFGVAFTLSSLYANNELTVIFASGISLLKFTAPLLIFSFFLSFAFFYFENNYVVPNYKRKVALQKELLGEEENKNNDKVVVLSESGRMIYKADFYDDVNKRLYALYVVFRNEDKSLDKIVYAETAVWKEDHWSLSNAYVYRVKDGELTVDRRSADLSLELTEPPDTFRNFEISVEEVNTKDARAYIALLRRTGLPSSEAMSVYYKKYSFPSVIFLVVFLSIGLSGKSRKNVLLMSLISCVSAAVLFYVTQMVTMYMAKFDVISPFAGAWLPVFIFIGISIALIKFART